MNFNFLVLDCLRSNFCEWWEWLKRKIVILIWNIPRPHWWLVNIGPGNGLMPSCNKPSSEPMLAYLSMSPHGIIRPRLVKAVCSITVFDCLPKIHSETCFWVFCTLLQNTGSILQNDYSWLRLQNWQSALINVWWILVCSSSLRTQSNLCVIIVIRRSDKCMQWKLSEEMFWHFENW